MISHNSSSNIDSHRKRHITLWVVVSLILTVLMLPILVLGWLGFVPGLSKLMGASDPRDLGVSYSQVDLDSYKQKTAVRFVDSSQAPKISANSGESTTFADVKTVNNLELTDKELTAAINNMEWTWLPISNVQTRFSAGSLELSGKFDSAKLDNLRNYLSEQGGLNPDTNNAISWAERLSNDAPFYAKANAVIANNTLSFKLVEAEIGRLDIPLGKMGKDIQNGTTVGNINSQYLNVDSAQLASGKLIFSGSYPSTIYIEQ